ncbi:MAG: right-handed parallel beta-helix repeat-containing protein, partial [Actinomycetes bacterium]
ARDAQQHHSAMMLLCVSSAFAATVNVGPTRTYTTILAGVNAALSGDTVKVDTGTYAEKNIPVSKSLTIEGEPGDGAPGPAVGAPIIDGGGAMADAFYLTNGVSNVTIRGFEMRNFLGTGDTDGNGIGVRAWVATTSNVTVSDNWFHDVGYGVMASNGFGTATGTHTNWTVSRNVVEKFSDIGIELSDASNSTIEGNVVHMTAAGAKPALIGVFSAAYISQSNLTISGNSVDGVRTGFPAVYVYAYDAESPNPNLNNVTIANNLLTATGTSQDVMVRDIGGTVTGVHVNNNSLASIRNLTAVSFDAASNWWGQASGPGAGKVLGTVVTTPWISTYTLNPAKTGEPGFWPFISTPVPAGGGTVVAGDVTATFPSGSTAGTLTVAPLDPSTDGPFASQAWVTNLFADISYTGTLPESGKVTVVLQVPVTYTGSLSALKVWHNTGSAWVQVTPVTADAVARTLTFEVSSFSDYGITYPVTGTPASSDWSIMLALLAAAGVLVWFARKQGLLAS